jgi:hypothetical protein
VGLCHLATDWKKVTQCSQSLASPGNSATAVTLVSYNGKTQSHTSAGSALRWVPAVEVIMK